MTSCTVCPAGGPRDPPCAVAIVGTITQLHGSLYCMSTPPPNPLKPHLSGALYHPSCQRPVSPGFHPAKCRLNVGSVSATLAQRSAGTWPHPDTYGGGFIKENERQFPDDKFDNGLRGLLLCCSVHGVYSA